jgi:hypothetical protein
LPIAAGHLMPGSTARIAPETKKPTCGVVTEAGCLRCDLSIPYRAIPPHGGALLRQQQMHAAKLTLQPMGRLLSYSGGKESQFEWLSHN